MEKVLVRDSTYETCAAAVAEAFEIFPIAIKGKKVCIKPNGYRAVDLSVNSAYVTDYRVLEAVIKKVESLGPKEIVVGDSVATEYYGNSEEAMAGNNVKKVAGSYYKNLNKNLRVLELERPYKRPIAVFADVMDCDVFISVPKMKTHGLTMISGGVKNNFGIIAGAQKAWLHYISITPERFANGIIETYKWRKPDLIIMDGIIAMEGFGPGSPDINYAGKILAATDGMAMDTVFADMIGFSADEVPTLKAGKAEGIGETDIGNIEVVGSTKLDGPYKVPSPARATFSYKAGVGMDFTNIAYYRDRASYRPVIEKNLCMSSACWTGDGPLCVKNCPAAALSKQGEDIACNNKICLQCCSCMEWCPVKAIEMKPHEGVIKEYEQYEKDQNYPVYD